MFSYNPFKNLSFDRTQQTSFFQKLIDTYYVFAGKIDPIILTGVVKYEHLGLLEFPFFSRTILNFAMADERARLLKYLAGFFGVIFFILHAIAAFVLTLISVPIVGLVHLLTQPVIPESSNAPGRTPVWKSFVMNPNTLLGCFIITVGISFLLQRVNPALFLGAASGLSFLASCLLVAGLLVWIMMGISGLRYSLGNWSLKKPGSISHPITDYFNEWFEWVREYKAAAVLIWGIGLSAAVTGIVFTALYFTGASVALPDTFIGQIFGFMSHGIVTSLHSSVTNWFGFTGSVEAILPMAQGLAAFVLIAGSLILTSMLGRFAQTLFRVSKAKIEYNESKNRPNLEEEGAWPAIILGDASYKGALGDRDHKLGVFCQIVNGQLYVYNDQAEWHAEPLLVQQAFDKKLT